MVACPGSGCPNPGSGPADRHHFPRSTDGRRAVFSAAAASSERYLGKGWQAIEQELRSKGFPRAKLLLDNDRIRDKLDELCKSAQEKRADANRA